MIQRQKEIISQQNEEIARARATFEENRHMKPAYDYYMLIQKQCQNSQTVADEFQRFMTVLRLSLDEDIPGITEAEADADQYVFDWRFK